MRLMMLLTFNTAVKPYNIASFLVMSPSLHHVCLHVPRARTHTAHALAAHTYPDLFSRNGSCRRPHEALFIFLGNVVQ